METTKTGLILLSSLLLPLNLLATSGDGDATRNARLIAPSITVSDAVGTKPGTIYTSGQTPRTVNVAWDAGTDWTDCEIYYTVNDANQAELGRGHDGAKPLTVTAGNAYHLWMVVYPGGGKFKVVTELKLVAEEGMQSSSPRAVRIDRIQVETGPNHVLIRFTALPNQRPYVAIGRGPAFTQNNELVFGENLVGGGIIGLETVTEAQKARGEYLFASAVGSTISTDGLQPGQTYYYIITIPAAGGRPAEQYSDKFTMLGQTTTVRVTWDKIIVEDDSDDFSTAELIMWFWTNYGQPSAKYSTYGNKDADSDHTYDIKQADVIENAPNTLSLIASGEDNDHGFVTGAFDEEGNRSPVSGPAEKAAWDRNVAKGEFDLTQYAENTRVPFRLNSMPGGSLKFVILGYFEYSRATVGLGAPSTIAIRPQPRVRSGGGTTLSAPPICVAAKQARERNSPAAPGLEEKCREQEGVKPTARVKEPDGTTSKSKLTKCEAAKQARARNSPAARGLEAQCAEEQKR